MLAASKSPPADVATAIAVLRQRFGDRLQTGEAIRRQHANNLTWIPNQPPDAVIWVENQDEVCEVVRVARTHRVPIIPFGAGTSLEGHINAPRGGLSLDFSRMNRVLAVNERDLDAVVEPGVSRKQLNDYLRDLGLFFPVDPGAEEATIGGMASTRASGTTAVRYGTMRENVLNVTAVMADGSVVKTAQRARKSAAGYDLTRLLVGSEGTLGIITEVTVRLYGIPERILSAVCPFATLEGACNAVIQSIQLGLGVARMELLDPPQIRAVNIYSKLGLEEKPTLFLEFHGTEAGARDQVESLQGHRRVRGRDPLRLGREGGGPPPALEGAARCLLGRQDGVAGPGRICNRRVRADLAACRMRGRDAEGHRGPWAWSRRSSATSATATSTLRRRSTATTPRRWRRSRPSSTG